MFVELNKKLYLCTRFSAEGKISGAGDGAHPRDLTCLKDFKTDVRNRRN